MPARISSRSCTWRGPKRDPGRARTGRKARCPGWSWPALVCSQAMRKNPRYAPIHNTAGLVDMELGNLSRAAAEFEEARRLDPRFVEAHLNYAAVNLGFRGYAQAEEAYRKVLAIQPRRLRRAARDCRSRFAGRSTAPADRRRGRPRPPGDHGGRSGSRPRGRRRTSTRRSSRRPRPGVGRDRAGGELRASTGSLQVSSSTRQASSPATPRRRSRRASASRRSIRRSASSAPTTVNS